jgi:hypothetical protein
MYCATSTTDLSSIHSSKWAQIKLRIDILSFYFVALPDHDGAQVHDTCSKIWWKCNM